MSRRLLSNIVILLLFASGFFGFTFAVNWFAQAESRPEHEFSFERRTADNHLTKSNWEDAARYYKQLCQSDPDNGGARFSYAWSLSQRQQPYLNQIRRELRSRDPDLAVAEEAAAEANRFSAEAIKAWEEVLEFANFRDNARFRLSLLHALAGNKQQAMDYLVLAQRSGYRPRYSITEYAQYWQLLSDPDFQKLIR